MTPTENIEPPSNRYIPPALRRGIRCVATGLIFALTLAWTQTRPDSSLTKQADDLSTEIISCLTSKTPVQNCAASSVPRLRRLRAQIDAYAWNNPRTGAIWARYVASLDTMVDKVVQSSQRPSLLGVAFELQILADTLPNDATGAATPSAPAAPTAAPAASNRSAKAPVTDLPGKPIQQADFSLVPAGRVELNTWASDTPEMKLKFSIERANNTPFTGLIVDRITAKVDGPAVTTPEGRKLSEFPIALKPSDLVTKSAADSSVILVIDGSGSMTATTRGQSGERDDKLSAAKSAIGDFIDKLKPEDKVAIIDFDAEPRLLFNLSSDKSAARAAIDAFHIQSPGSIYTALYDAMDMAVRKAKELSLKNVVILTDGVEDSQQFGVLKDSEKNSWKRQREDHIAKQALESGVRIFTIGIGDKKADRTDSTMAYVDCDTLSRISKLTNGGECNYVDLPDLVRNAKHSARDYHAALASQLSGILSEINKAFHYDYTLVLRPDPHSLFKDGQPHLVTVLCYFDRVKLPVSFIYTWDPRTGLVEVDKPKPGIPTFLREPDKRMSVSALAIIYVRCILALLVLALIPQLFRWVFTRHELAAVRYAVLTIPDGSAYIGCECPNERNRLGSDFLIKKGDHVIVCPNPDCRTPHHLSCWHENRDRCWVRVAKTGNPCNTPIELSPAVLKAYGLKEKQGALA